jgi:hypothetical protein
VVCANGRRATKVRRRGLERAKGFEPSAPTLARLCSTPELHPHPSGGAAQKKVPKFRYLSQPKRTPPTCSRIQPVNIPQCPEGMPTDQGTAGACLRRQAPWSAWQRLATSAVPRPAAARPHCSGPLFAVNLAPERAGTRRAFAGCGVRATPALDQRVEPRSHSTTHHVGPGFLSRRRRSLGL